MTGAAGRCHNQKHDAVTMDMSLFKGLYRHPAEAVLREYLSNASDAHTAKGGKLPPIQVTLPKKTDENPLLTVRDFGNGMSENEIIAYTAFRGASTRKRSNAFMGGQGLGSKAGFAVGSEFFMTSYQNGTGLRVRVHENSKQQGLVEVVERFSTDELDGLLVEVTVPSYFLTDLDEEALSQLFMAYELDGLEVTPSYSRGLSLHDPEQFACLKLNGSVRGWVDIHSAKRMSSQAILRSRYRNMAVPDNGKLLFVIGKVAYNIKSRELASILIRGEWEDWELSNFFRFLSQDNATHVLNLPIASVDINASRDRILLSNRSLETIFSALTDYRRLLHAELQKQLNSLSSRLEAGPFVAALENNDYENYDGFSWRGKKVGLAQLQESKAIVRMGYPESIVLSPKPMETRVNTYRRFSTFWELVGKDGDAIVILVAAEEDISTLNDELNKINSLTLLRELSTLLSGNSHWKPGKPTRQGKFIIITEADELWDVVSGWQIVEHSVIKSLIEKQQRSLRKAADTHSKNLTSLFSSL